MTDYAKSLDKDKRGFSLINCAVCVFLVSMFCCFMYAIINAPRKTYRLIQPGMEDRIVTNVELFWNTKTATEVGGGEVHFVEPFLLVEVEGENND